MRKALILLAILGASAASFGQAVQLPANGGYAADSPYNRLYNTRSVITFKGQVSGIQVAPPMEGMGNAITLLVKTSNGGTALVDVGPEWYVANQKAEIKLKDKVQVTGSRVMIGKRSVILAEQIVKNKDVLALRRPNGNPYWDAVTQIDPNDVGNGDTVGDPTMIVGQIINTGSYNDGTYGPLAAMTIHTDNGDVNVALAPTWFLRRQELTIQPGDYVRVRVMPASPAGSAYGAPIPPRTLIASGVYRGSAAFILRYENGRPVWYGWTGRG